MQFHSRFVMLCAVNALMPFVSGCGESPPDTAPAGGRVLFNDKPLANASVNFIPENGKAANGVTDSQGKFTLTTFQPNDGAIVGTHKVTVTVVSTEEVPEIIPDDYSYTNAGTPDDAADGSGIPEVYADPRSTPLKYEVKGGEDNNFEVKLE